MLIILQNIQIEDIQNIGFWKGAMKYMLAQIDHESKIRENFHNSKIKWNNIIFKIHLPNIENTIPILYGKKMLLNIQCLYKQIMDINIGMKIFYYFKMMRKDFMNNTMWLGSQDMNVAMKILHEMKLQHQGYESHQYLIFYEKKLLWKKMFSIFVHLKEGYLFVLLCFYRWDPLNRGWFRSHFWFLWKTLEEEGCIGLVSWRLDLRCKSSWILNYFFIEILI